MSKANYYTDVGISLTVILIGLDRFCFFFPILLFFSAHNLLIFILPILLFFAISVVPGQHYNPAYTVNSILPIY